MKTCATCKYLGGLAEMSVPDDNGDYQYTEHRRCARIIHGNGHDLMLSTVLAEPALVTDGSGYAARLIVLPTFGCALHASTVEGTQRDDMQHAGEDDVD
jgi:hypothetical protein